MNATRVKQKTLKMKTLVVAMFSVVSIPTYTFAAETGGYLLDNIEIIGQKNIQSFLPIPVKHIWNPHSPSLAGTGFFIR